MFLHINSLGNIDAQSVLPHPTTVSRRVTDLYYSHRARIIEFLDNASLVGFALDLDFWSEQLNKRSLLSFNIHFIDGDFVRHHIVLDTLPVPIGETKNFSLIDWMRTNFMESFGLEFIKNVAYMTDGGSNFIKSLLKEVIINSSRRWDFFWGGGNAVRVRTPLSLIW